MKKCMICVVLMCFALAACATVTNQPATEPQMNVTTTSSTATTIPATNSTVTTVPPASSTVATTPSVTTIPTTVPTIGTTTASPITTQQTTTKVYVDYYCAFTGHVYENGNCIYCGRKQAAGDVGASQTTTAATTTKTTISPASTSSVTTSVDITKPATTMVSTTVSTAATSCKPTKPITVPTTTSPTTAPSTVPTTTASPTTSTTPTVSSSTARYVRVISGDQAITPKEAYYRGRYWTNYGWSLACGKGIVWEWLDWTQIPVITLDEALTIERNPDAAFSQELRLKLVDAENFEYIDLELVNTLPSGTYMVEFNITYYRSEEVNGEKQFDSYTYGFFLEVP